MERLSPFVARFGPSGYECCFKSRHKSQREDYWILAVLTVQNGTAQRNLA